MTESIQNDTYRGTISFQDVTVVDVGPDSSWFDGGLLTAYASFDDWLAGSVYAKTPMWGPQGLLGAYATQVIVGYAPSLQMTFQNWSQSEAQQQWQASGSFNIGPFPLASAAASGASASYQYQETENGISVFDGSGIPKILGVVVATPNFNG